MFYEYLVSEQVREVGIPADLCKYSLPIMTKKVKRLRSTVLWLSLVVLALTLPIIYIMLQAPKKAQAEWWNPVWLYRQSISFTNSGSAITTARKVKVDVDTATLITASQLQSDCDDIRFTDQNGKLLDFFIDTNTADCNNASTDFYVKVLNVLAGEQRVYMYYGNTNAARTEPGGRKNDFFDDAGLSTALKGYWKMNESTANTCTNGTDDSCDSGLANDGAWNGDATTTTTSKLGGRAVTLDGTGDFIAAGTNSSLEVQSYTFTAWINPTSLSGCTNNRCILASKANDITVAGVEWAVSNTGRLAYGYNNGALRGWYEDGVSTISTGAWTHIAFTWNSSTGLVSYYVNGVLSDTDSASAGTIVYSSDTFRIGFQSQNGYWNGVLDDVRVYNRVLNASEITNLYYGGGGQELPTPVTYTPNTGPTAASAETTPGPIAYWKFDEGQGQTVNDNTTKSNGTLGANSSAASDDPTWIAEDRCVTGKCLQFDGSNDYVNVSGSIVGVQSVGFWVKSTSTTASMIALTSGARITASSGTISATGFTSPTIYVNGLVSTTLTANKWNYIEVTTGTAITANAITIGTANSAFTTGFIDDVKIYPYARTAAQVKVDFTAGAAVLGAQDQKDFLSDGLVGYWKMDESSANGCTGGANDSCDSSGNVYDGAWNGNATTAVGKFGNGTTYDGTGDYTNVPTPTAIQTLTFTYAAWVKPSGSGERTVFAWDSTGGRPQVRVNDTLVFLSAGVVQIASGGTVSNSVWSHIAVSFNDTTKSYVLFVNGSQVASGTYSTGFNSLSGRSLRIGDREDVEAFNGVIDEARVYNRVLSPDDVRNLYNWAPGPVGYWKLDEGSANTCTGGSNDSCDTSGTGNDGAWNGNATATDGKFGNGVTFDGSNSYVDMGDVLDPGSNSCTSEFWINVAATPSTGERPFSKGGHDTALMPCFGYYFNSNLNLITGDQIDTVTATVDTTLTTNTWKHVTTVRDVTNNKLSLYVDGVLVDTGTITAVGDASNAKNLTLGAVHSGSSRTLFFNGKLDDVRVYNYARTSQQIVEDMNAGHPTGGSPIGSQVVRYKFDEQQGSTANNEVSANSSITGSISGATWKTKENCKLNGCLDYDGTDDVTTVTNASAIDLNNNLAAGFTMSGWIYADSAGENSVGEIFNKGTTTYCRTDTPSGSNLDLECSLDLATTDATVNISSGLTTGTWYHVAVGYTDDSDDEITVYINGVARGTSTNGSGAPAAESSNLLIGGSSSANFDGKIDEFKVYNSELTVDQIRIDYNLGAAVKYSVGQDEAADLTDGAGNPPVLEMKLDEKTGTTTNSTSGTFTGTLTSGPTWAAGKYGSAVNFDGSDDFVDIGTGPTSVKSVAFWVYPATTTEYPIDINGTAYVWINAGTVTAQGFTSPTIYVNGRVSSTITANTWQHIEVTTGTALNASDFDIGRIEGVGNHEGKIDQVVLYDYARTQAQVAYDYNRGAPIGWWKMDECQGTTAYDSSGVGNNGTITIGASGTEDTVGTCQTSSTAWGSGASGKYSASLDFDGTDDYIDTGSSSFNFTTQPFSVSAWVYSDDLGSGVNAEIAATDKANSPTSGWGFLLVGPNENLRLVTRGTSPSNIDSGSSVPINTWSHVAATFSGTSGTVALYINGVVNKTSTYTGSITSAACNLQIGRRFSSSCSATAVYFNGKIDDVRIYNYALSAAQVRKVYNEGASVRYGN